MTTVAGAMVGDEIPGRVLGPVTRMDFARFSVAIDDPNRVHIEEDVAAAVGLPQVIGSGGIVAGLLTETVAEWAGIDAVRAGSVRMFFPLFPDVTLTSSGRVIERGDGTLTVAAEVVDGAGNKIGEARYTVAAVR